MQNKIQDLAVGAGGILSVEGVNFVMPTDPGNSAEAGSLVIQIIIGIVTLFGLFKKRK